MFGPLVIHLAMPVTKKNKHVPVHLQAQWDKDRRKKADFKLARAEARLAEQLDPYSSSSKKSRNKNKRAKAYSSANADDSEAASFSFDTPSRGGKNNRSPITDLLGLDQEIQRFLEDLGKTTMSLPPMEKTSRVRVHQLAECYSIKSQSRGSGRARFT